MAIYESTVQWRATIGGYKTLIIEADNYTEAEKKIEENIAHYIESLDKAADIDEFDVEIIEINEKGEEDDK